MRKLPLLKILLLACALYAVSSCDNSQQTDDKQQTPRLVRTLTVIKPEQNFWRELPGEVDVANKADLGFRIAGKLEKLLASEGEIVKSGQLLAQLDATDQTIQLHSRKAEYDQAHADLERGQALVKKDLISRSDFNKLQAQDATAKANLEAAKQNLDHTFLRAPFSGRIAKRYVENYEEVSSMQAVYALHDPSSMSIRVDVPESVIINVRKGSKPRVNALFDAIPGKQFPLTMKEVSTQADKDTNTFEVTFSMPVIEGYNILPGMSVTVRGEHKPDTTKNSDSVFVPAHAVLEDTGGRFVYVVNATDHDRGIVERRTVKTGSLSNLGLEVTSGLKESDKVVTAGMSKMHPGLEVKLAQENTD